MIATVDLGHQEVSLKVVFPPQNVLFILFLQGSLQVIALLPSSSVHNTFDLSTKNVSNRITHELFNWLTSCVQTQGQRHIMIILNVAWILKAEQHKRSIQIQ